MKLPIDTSALKFASGGAPKPIVDFGTKMPKLDENGVPMFQVTLFTITSDGEENLKVKVSGEPKGLTPFGIVKITNLMAQTWEVNDQHGVSFRADAIEPSKVAA